MRDIHPDALAQIQAASQPAAVDSEHPFVALLLIAIYAKATIRIEWIERDPLAAWVTIRFSETFTVRYVRDSIQFPGYSLPCPLTSQEVSILLAVETKGK